jgi:hypothetical protein
MMPLIQGASSDNSVADLAALADDINALAPHLG